MLQYFTFFFTPTFCSNFLIFDFPQFFSLLAKVDTSNNISFYKTNFFIEYKQSKIKLPIAVKYSKPQQDLSIKFIKHFYHHATSYNNSLKVAQI